MLNIALVDDESDSIEKIKVFLDAILVPYDVEYSISTFTDGNNLLNSGGKYDLLLLDIDMPTINGFELAENYNKVLLSVDNVSIIYISNYDDLVFESFRYSPLRFIRKNKLDEELSEAINAFMLKYNSEKDYFNFTERESNREIKIRVIDIMYFEAYSHDIYLASCTGKKYSIKRIGGITLNVLEDRYKNKGFIRSHKSYLVNCYHVFEIHGYKIIFTNNDTALISARNLRDFKQKYQDYIMRG